jgi:hypothetical protein
MLRGEVLKRVPAILPEEPAESKDGTKVIIETITVDELSPPDVLKDRQDLESWLKALRERLGILLDEHKQVRITRK